MFTLSTQQLHSPLFHSPILPLYHNGHIFRSMNNSDASYTKSANDRAPRWKHAPNPQRQTLNQSSSQRRESRNASLLQGIQERRQHARDQTRSEQILRSDMLAEQRAWEEAQEAEAARWNAYEEEDVHMQSDAELEEYLRREEEELQARAEEAMKTKTVDQNGEEFGNKQDDDFDMLVLEAVEEFERSQQNGQRDMDLT